MSSRLIFCRSKPKPQKERGLSSLFLQLYFKPIYILFYSKTLNPELIAAASAAASTLKNSSQAESELLRKMRQHESITETQRKGDVKKLGYVINISDYSISIFSWIVYRLFSDFNSLWSKFIHLYFRGLIADMKIGKKLDIQNTWAANPIRFDDDGRGYTPKNTGQLEGKSTR